MVRHDRNDRELAEQDRFTRLRGDRVISQIIAYFGNLERSLLKCVAVVDYTVLRYEVTSTDGKMRLRAQLQDGVQVDLFEYITLGVQEQLIRLKYSYHWQSADGLLVRRWDGVHHHLHLPNALHHVHLPDGQVQGVDQAPSITTVLDEIMANLRMENTTNV
jgi:hypothetical protein